jgi:hypothetical protein
MSSGSNSSHRGWDLFGCVVGGRAKMAAATFKWLAALGLLSIVDFFTSGGLLLGSLLSTDNDTHFITKNYSFACVIVDLLIVSAQNRILPPNDTYSIPLCIRPAAGAACCSLS